MPIILALVILICASAALLFIWVIYAICVTLRVTLQPIFDFINGLPHIPDKLIPFAVGCFWALVIGCVVWLIRHESNKGKEKEKK